MPWHCRDLARTAARSPLHPTACPPGFKNSDDTVLPPGLNASAVVSVPLLGLTNSPVAIYRAPGSIPSLPKTRIVVRLAG